MNTQGWPYPAFNRDPAFIYTLVRLHPAFIRGPAFIRRRRLIEEIRYIYIYINIAKIQQTRVGSLPVGNYIYQSCDMATWQRNLRKRSKSFP